VNHHLFRALLEAACLACEEVCDYRRLGARRVSDADAALFRETAQLIERLKQPSDGIQYECRVWHNGRWLVVEIAATPLGALAAAVAKAEAAALVPWAKFPTSIPWPAEGTVVWTASSYRRYALRVRQLPPSVPVQIGSGPISAQPPLKSGSESDHFQKPPRALPPRRPCTSRASGSLPTAAAKKVGAGAL